MCCGVCVWSCETVVDLQPSCWLVPSCWLIPSRAILGCCCCCCCCCCSQAEEFARVQEPLFRQISRCLTSSHFQVGIVGGWQDEVGRVMLAA